MGLVIEGLGCNPWGRGDCHTAYFEAAAAVESRLQSDASTPTGANPLATLLIMLRLLLSLVFGLWACWAYPTLCS